MPLRPNFYVYLTERHNAAVLCVARRRCNIILTDRSITCWGDNWAGQADAPAGAHTALSASGASGAGRTCAVRADGAIICWGERASYHPVR